MYKNLLVEVDDSAAVPRRIDYAIQLSRRFDAHLSGLYLIPMFTPPPAVGAYMTEQMEAQILAGEIERAEKALDRLRQAAEAADIEFDTRTDRGPYHEHARLLSTHGRYADLTIVGQPDPNDGGSSLDPGEVVLTAGAPVVIVPHIGAPSTTTQRVMIAWNASREAARAVRDAMPLLEKAKAVDIVCFHPEDTPGHGETPGADIGLHLSRHDIKVDVQILESEGIDVGNALLSHIADSGSDFLVMGGYGHSRLREAVLGGATRTILQSMTVPVLMAH
ncbi:MAG: universal stress protein [Alphaproteobacteria bacterium]|nr:universal stress protein [Alphaproteobacteria bacterium]